MVIQIMRITMFWVISISVQRVQRVQTFLSAACRRTVRGKETLHPLHPTHPVGGCARTEASDPGSPNPSPRPAAASPGSLVPAEVPVSVSGIATLSTSRGAYHVPATPRCRKSIAISQGWR